MEGLRGRPTPDDSALSPKRRLERAMKGLAEAEDVEVQRSTAAGAAAGCRDR